MALKPARPRAAAPGSTASLKAANQHRVIALLQSGEERVSQAEIARATGLAPATVSNIVRELSAAGLVETTLGSGRRGSTVRISPAAGLVAGLDFGHRHVRVAIGDLAGQVVAQRREAISPEHDHTEGLALAGTLLEKLLDEHGRSLDHVLTVGLGLPAPIGEDHIVMAAGILPGWVGVNAQEQATLALGRPVHVDNDANFGALAEHRRGAGVGHPTMVFVKVSSGVGAGLVLSGRLFRGAGGTAGEIGHLTLDEQGPLCRCGSRGCLEAYAASGTAEAMMADQIPRATVSDIVEAGRTGHMGALRVFEDAGLHLGWGLAMVANLINPSAIIVGGDMSQAGDMLLDPVRVGLRRHALASVAAQTVVKAAELGDRASVIGALMVALDRTELVPSRV
jgi:predicted NBD/HSP70 family sugar kinase